MKLNSQSDNIRRIAHCMRHARILFPPNARMVSDRPPGTPHTRGVTALQCDVQNVFLFWGFLVAPWAPNVRGVTSARSAGVPQQTLQPNSSRQTAAQAATAPNPAFAAEPEESPDSPGDSNMLTQHDNDRHLGRCSASVGFKPRPISCRPLHVAPQEFPSRISGISYPAP